MTWVQIQKSQQATWDDYERVRARIGDERPPGLIGHYAGEVDGRWEAVSIWESREAAERFREDRVMPAVREVFGEDAVAAGPPPQEWFEVKHTLGG